MGCHLHAEDGLNAWLAWPPYAHESAPGVTVLQLLLLLATSSRLDQHTLLLTSVLAVAVGYGAARAIGQHQELRPEDAVLC
jgi:hypothetical protein